MSKTKPAPVIEFRALTIDGTTPATRTVDVYLQSGKTPKLLGKLKLDMRGEYRPDRGGQDGHRFALYLEGTLTINGIGVEVRQGLRVLSSTWHAAHVYDPADPGSWRCSSYLSSRRVAQPGQFLGSSDLPDGVRQVLYTISRMAANLAARYSDWRDAADFETAKDDLSRAAEERAGLLRKVEDLDGRILDLQKKVEAMRVARGVQS